MLCLCKDITIFLWGTWTDTNLWTEKTTAIFAVLQLALGTKMVRKVLNKQNVALSHLLQTRPNSHVGL